MTIPSPQGHDQTDIGKVHFIGIGGVGMSGVARVAHDQGMQVSGSDLKESRYTKQLRDIGIEVSIGHSAKNIPDPAPDVVVVSTAILENNEELKAAYGRNLPIWHRARMLAALGRGQRTLAVAGTHGKTTTSSMLASTLDALNTDPSFLIGGIVRSYGTNARFGQGPYYVVEADESDKSFTYLKPSAILVTNIEADHLDHYEDLAEIYDKFGEFIGSAQDLCVVCGEDGPLVELARRSGVRFQTYGFGEGFDIMVSDYQVVGAGSSFTVRMPDGGIHACHIKQNPGRHNALNAAGVLGMVAALGHPVDAAAEALACFDGVRRRFDLIGKAGGVTVIDDYAHHPTEIAATIRAAKALDFKRVWVLFQPHRYSRVGLFTEVLKDEFATAFDEADSIVFMDVYPAGETPVPGVSGKTFLNVILDHPGHPPASYLPHQRDIVPYLAGLLRPGDLVITMGAGDVTAIAPQLLDALQARTQA
ncbi:MAG: UDP-N-acetylmuramate--L-alanine ligase [Coriobacteriaceae bacterium]|nr:UDP-N-acetylmuramate--L-alanine ligase [Coriobacteriaceae bacterium]